MPSVAHPIMKRPEPVYKIEQHNKLAAMLHGSRPGAQSASLYDNFCKTGNDVIDDVIIWVQDGNCKKMARENFSTGAFYNITKNKDNPIKTVKRDSFSSPKTPKNTSF